MNWFGFIIGTGGVCIVIQLYFWYMASRWEDRKREVLAFMKTLPEVHMDCSMPPPQEVSKEAPKEVPKEVPMRKMFH